MKNRSATGLEIAVIGYSGRFSECEDLQEFWDVLEKGEESLHTYDKNELRELGVTEELMNDENYVYINGMMSGKDAFDTGFWGYTPEEVMYMDPQVRLFHECVWNALESAGYNPKEVPGRVGLYGAASNNPMWAALMPFQKSSYVDIKNIIELADREFMCSRIAYKLNLKGPAMMIQTACSSSLVAVHNANRALLTGECDVAVAGGVSASMLDRGGYLYRENMILSSDGHCRTFDDAADGTVGGEGVGAVVLKRLERAIKDGDPIHGVILGSAINNDGNDKVGYTAPSVFGQAQAIQSAMSMAKVSPDHVQYIETHGTATKLGDPVEVEGLKLAYEKLGYSKGASGAIPLGAVKSNIGHLDAAAGISALIKVLLMLKHKKIPQVVHFNKPNRNINFSATPFFPNDKLRTWTPGEQSRIAGISSFGIGGTNAHAVISDWVSEIEKDQAPTRPEVITVSANSEASLYNVCEKLAEKVQQDTNISLNSLAYTLNTGRHDFAFRKSFICTQIEDAGEMFTDHARYPIHEVDVNNFDEKIVFVFSGQGAQYASMAKGLYDNFQIFSDQMDNCFEVLEKEHGFDLKGVLFSEEADTSALINETKYSQLGIFSVSYSLARMLNQLGIVADHMIGHSIGEFVCACLSGVFTLSEALSIVLKRGELMEQAKQGLMYSIHMTKDELVDILPAEVSIASVNSEKNCVISGDAAIVQRFVDGLQEKGVNAKKLATNKAFHSKLMEESAVAFETFLSESNIEFKQPNIDYVSNVTGEMVGTKLTPSYFGAHIRSTVLFMDGINSLQQRGKTNFVELGPGGQLLPHISSIGGNADFNVFGTIRHVRSNQGDVDFFLSQLANLWRAGATVNWSKLYLGEKKQRVTLPGYAFEKNQIPLPEIVTQLITGDFSTLLPNSQAPTTNEAVDRWIHRPYWEKRTTSPPQVQDWGNTRVLVFQPTSQEPICEALLTSGAKTIKVTVDSTFRQLSDSEYSIDPTNRDHYDKLISSLAHAGFEPTHLVHALYLAEEAMDTSAWNAVLSKGYISLMHLIRAIGKANWTHAISLSLLATDTTIVESEDVINPLKRSALGALKVIPLEYPNLNCQLIDVSLRTQDTSIKNCTDLIYEEFGGTRFLALRGNEKFVPGYERVDIEEAEQSNIEFKEDGFYLITGGFGGMGFSVAQDLARSSKVNVVLIVRSDFPERKDWDQWLSTHESDDKNSVRIKKIRACEQHGSCVSVAKADVSDKDKLGQAIGHATSQFGPLRGIIWAAGVIDDGGIIQTRAEEDFLSYTRSKIHGLLTIMDLVDLSTLDFMSVFSSMGNILYHGKFGQVAYNVSNEFVESFSAYASKRFGIRVNAINWNDWRDVGMTVRAVGKKSGENRTEYINQMLGEDVVSPDQGVRIFRNCLNGVHPAYYISKYDIDHAIKKSQENLLKQGKLNLAKRDAVQKFPRPKISVKYQAPINEVETKLAHLFSNLFGYDQVGRNDDFFELGGDSLKAMALIVGLEEEFGTRISLESFFNNPKIELLAQVLSGEDEEVTEVIVEEVADEANDTAKSDEILVKEFDLSPAQRRMYLINSLNNQSLAYNQVFAFKFEQLDLALLQQSIEQLLLRHDILRTSFHVKAGEIIQRVNASTAFILEEKQVTEDSIHDELAVTIRPFDLETAPLIRGGVLHIEQQDYKIVWFDVHHIISDGQSNAILLDELFRLYTDKQLEDVGSQYADFVNYVNQPETKASYEGQKVYWLNKLSGGIERLSLHTDHARPLERSFEVASQELEIPSSVYKQVKGFLNENKGTSFLISISVLHILLWKLTAQKNILIGTVSNGRTQNRFLNTLGMFINTVVTKMNFEASGDVSFKEFFHLVRKEVLQSLDNQDYPFDELVAEIETTRDRSRTPIFDVLIQSEELSTVQQGDANAQGDVIQIERYGFRKKHSAFDLRINVIESSDGLSYQFEYATELFSAETMQRYVSYFEHVLHSVVEDPLMTISNITLGSRPIDLVVSNKPEFQSPATIYTSIAKNFVEHKDQIALRNEHGVAISYGELGNRVNKLAHYLHHESGINKNDVVAIYVEPSVDMMVAMLGIMGAGAGFLPIDTKTPSLRVKQMLEESKAKLVVLDSRFLHDFLEYECSVFAIDIQLQQVDTSKSIEITYDPQDLAYIIFTSGSTGTPKGVKISQMNLMNYVNWFESEMSLSGEDSSILLSSYAFDLGYSSLFPTLKTGGQLHVVNKNLIYSSNKLLKYIYENEVSFLKLSPSLFSVFASNQAFEQHLSKVKTVILGGESIQIPDVEKFLTANPNAKVINEYGPTETTVGVVYHQLDESNVKDEKAHSIIGKPIDHVEAVILDASMNVCPDYAVGELCIIGRSVGAGYINDPENANFIDDFYEGQRLYKTGDLARYLPGGQIEFLGRKDEQVKIRGYRVNPQEIENVAMGYEPVQGAFVTSVSVKETNEVELVAYYVLKKDLDVSRINNYLEKRLPEYFVPKFSVVLNELPLTGNGKVDKSRLPSPEINMVAGEIISAAGVTEEKLMAIWSRVLEIDLEKIGTNLGFFALGGNSLKAIQVVEAIENEFAIEITVVTLFDYTTIKELAAYIDEFQVEDSDTEFSPIDTLQLLDGQDGITNGNGASLKDEQPEEYSVSPAQRRIYLHNSINPNSTNYNQIFVFKTRGLHKDKLQEAFIKLIDRHEALRTSFHVKEKDIIQRIGSSHEVRIAEEAVSKSNVDEYLLNKVTPFQLDTYPLMRVGLFNLEEAESENIIWVDIHHIISDGLSNWTLLKELFELYSGLDVQPVETHYKEYVEYLNSSEIQNSLVSQKEYWLNKLAEKQEYPEIFADYQRPIKKSYRGSIQTLRLSKSMSEQLTRFSAENASSPFIVSVTMLYALLSKLTGQNQLAVGITSSGRDIDKFKSTIGTFINTLATRVDVEDDMDVLNLLKQVRKEVLVSLENQQYPFEEAIAELNLGGMINRNPVFDILFSSDTVSANDNLMVGSNELENGLVIEQYPFKRNTSNFDLRVSIHNDQEGFSYLFEYSTDLFKEETITFYANAFEKVLEGVLNEPTIKVRDIQLKDADDYIDCKGESFPLEEHQSIIERITENFGRFDEKIALRDHNSTLTYAELGSRVRKLANYMTTDLQIGKNHTVMIYMNPSADVIVSMLAALYVGAAFLPIDENTPPERLKKIISDADPKVILIDSDKLFEFSDASCPVFAIDIQLSGYSDEAIVPEINHGREDLAYVIYTSGSTGTPKGVLINNGNLLNYTLWLNQELNLSDADSTILLSSYAFDLGYTALFPILFAGGTLHVPRKDLYLAPQKLVRYLADHQLTYIKTTPSLFSLLINHSEIQSGDLSNLKYVMLGGESIRYRDVEKLLKANSDTTVINHYGPTETTIGVIFNRITSENLEELNGKSVIGKPIHNMSAYILDDRMRPFADYTVGELYVSGASVGMGYLGGENKAFIEQEFGGNKERLYRTGDLAMWYPDGSIVFLGRKDRQIKIRGYRVDQLEVENAARNFDGIQDAFIGTMDIDDRVELVLYYVAENEIKTEALKRSMSRSLPEYCIPAYTVKIDKIPLKANNKVDTAKLPTPKPEELDIELKKANGHLEERLVSIWANVLQLDAQKVGVNVGFFQYGGNSLTAVQMIGEVKSEFGIEIPIVAVFDHPTIEELVSMFLGKSTSEEEYATPSSNDALEIMNLLED